jgi:hypothetical protein
VEAAFVTEMTSPNRKDLIHHAADRLVGKKLWGCTRAADLVSFAFGERREVPDRRGGTKVVGEYALHVQSAWRITQADQVVLGGGDLYYPANYGHGSTDIPDGFDWDRDPNRCDTLIRLLFQEGKREFLVQRVDVGAAASLQVWLSDGLCLEVFPDDSLSDERWRLFRPGLEEPHFVVMGNGVKAG